MGQYYKAINLDNKQWLNSSGGGLKLTEHSWVGNDFVGRIMNLMLETGEWFKKRIVWAGDYYGDEGDEIDHYKQAGSSNKIDPLIYMTAANQKRAKLINHTKKLYVRYDEMPDKDGWVVNPLPILTALGNGRGGGDYSESQPDCDKVGIWAGDVLSISFTVPKSKWYKKLVVSFAD